MQVIANVARTRQHCAGTVTSDPTHSVQGIAYQRVSCCCQVNPDLVWSSCGNLDFDQRITRGATFNDPHEGSRGSPAINSGVYAAHDGIWHIADGLIHSKPIRQINALHKGTIRLAHATIMESPSDAATDRIRPREQDDAGCPAPQAMRRRPVVAALLAHHMEQCIL
jgi:hypothetical protein